MITPFLCIEGFKRQKTTEYTTELSQKEPTTSNKPTNTNDDINLESEERGHEENNNFRGQGHEKQLNGSIGSQEAPHIEGAHRIVRPLSFTRTSNRENIVTRHLGNV